MGEASGSGVLPKSLTEHADVRPSKTLILSDDPVIRNLAMRKLPHATYLSYTGLMKASNMTRLFDDVSLYWLDLPRGGRWRATKIRQLEKLYNSVLKDRDYISKVCILPAEHNWPSQFPRHRWQQVLSKWKTIFNTYLTLMF